MKTIGFIGSGNMSSAIIGGIIQANFIPTSHIIASDISSKKLNNLHQTYDIKTTNSNETLVKNVDVIILSVKPHILPNVLSEIKNFIKSNQILISIAAGVTIDQMEKTIGKKYKIARVMPNTPALVNEGMSAITQNKNISKNELTFVCNLFKSCGSVELVSEDKFHSVIGLAGSSPAYIFMLIEAMATAGIKNGLTADKAYMLSAQAVKGTAQMVIDSDMHPAKLREMVCSPGGTTIEAVASLESEGFRASIIKSIQDCIDKSIEMSNN